MPLLFSYGTLQLANVQLSTFGRLLEGNLDELLGYEHSLFKIEDPSDDVMSGSCLRGDVGYRMRKPFRRFAHCNCVRSQKATGTAHATSIYVNPTNLEWVAVHKFTKRFDLPSARSFATTFCTACGSP